MSSEKTTPAVAVVMAVHNYARFLPCAINSILSQTFTDFEFVIVDDGSIDRSSKILQRFAQRDSRIRIIRQDNQGLTVSLNNALAVSSAPLIARMDGDDISLPNRFEKQVQYLNENDDVAAVGGQILNINEFGSYIGTSFRSLDHLKIEESLLQGNGGAICHPAVMMRRVNVEHAGGYDTRYRTAQDLDLFLKLGENGRLANLNDYVLFYRQHSQSTNVRKHGMQLLNRRTIVEEACKRRNQSFSASQIEIWNKSTITEDFRSMAWRSLQNGLILRSRFYAMRALARSPLSPQSWKLLASTYRGY